MTNTVQHSEYQLPVDYVQLADGAYARRVAATLVDGANDPVAVKGASSSAQGSDPSLVVQLSPNTLGAGPGYPISSTISVAGSAVSAANPLPTSRAALTPQAWAIGGALNATAYATVRVQVDGIAGGDTIAFTASLASGGTAYALPANAIQDLAGNKYTAIGAAGIYLLPGGLCLTPAHTGTASSPVLTVSAMG